MNVVVTGARGFLGTHVAARLAADGLGVRGISRSTHAGAAPGVEMVVVPENAPASRRAEVLAGARALVHLAARVHVMRDTPDAAEAIRRANVEETGRWLEAARRAGVECLIFASSVKAVGEGSEEIWTDAVRPAPVDPYGRSKLAAEELLQQEAAASGPRVVILRLPLVYGPGVRANMLRLLSLVDRGVPLPFGLVRNRRSLLAARNAAAGIACALASTRAGGAPYFISDDDDVSTPELVRHLAAGLGRPARLLPVPPAAFRLAGRVGDLLAGAGWPLTSAAVDRLLGSLAVDISRFRADAGYRPVASVREATAELAAWYRSAR